MSFVDSDPAYTLQTVEGSPGENWMRATKGLRHWNAGIANDSDFWAASFPSDDMSLLPGIPNSMKVGSIRFGLSLLSGGGAGIDFRLVPCINPSGSTTYQQFCLSGYATGTGGLDTPFPIGLRTEILFHPLAADT
ncbi:MAG TPA: hypothetical protein VHI13_02435 [Candidatus Kapabacteria bacterium]|nr:hypothetical protein [Candidatus Kapabacteria bacterium]